MFVRLLVTVAVMGCVMGSCGVSYGVTVKENVDVDGKRCDVITWTDAAGKPRSISLVRSGGGKDAGGYIHRYVYNLGDRQVTAKTDKTMPMVSGLGVAVNHHSKASTSKRSSTDATTGFVLKGDNHCIWRFRSQYQGPSSNKRDKTKKTHPCKVGLVIDYAVCDGCNDVLWSVSYDCSKLADNEIGWDMRGPYMQFDWDGDGKFFGAPISGIRWGDKYHFKTVKYAGNNSTWDYTQPNVIPYAMLYKEGKAGDAECGFVQTVPWTVKPAGGYWWSASHWGKSGKGMMENWNCPYQLNAYENYGGEKMAWGSPYGAVGKSSYTALDMKTACSGYPYQGYSVYIVTGRHSDGPTDKLIKGLEAVQKVTLTAEKGRIPTRLPGYAGLTAEVDCTPAGWDGVYGQWVVACQDGQAKVNIDTGGKDLPTPTFRFTEFPGKAVDVHLDGKPLADGKGGHITHDTAGKRVFVTLAEPLKAGRHTLSVK